METESTTFGGPLLHAEVVLLNRTSIVDLAVAVGQLSCYSALTDTLLTSITITIITLGLIKKHVEVIIGFRTWNSASHYLHFAYSFLHLSMLLDVWNSCEFVT